MTHIDSQVIYYWNKGERSTVRHKETIMTMHASSYSFSQNCQPKVAITFYVGGITRTLSTYS